MELCDFSNVMKIIREYISDARAHSQTNAAPDVQKESIHTHTHTKIVDFGQIKNSETPMNTRQFGI